MALAIISLYVNNSRGGGAARLIHHDCTGGRAIALLATRSFSPFIARSHGTLSLYVQERGCQSLHQSECRPLDGINELVRENVIKGLALGVRMDQIQCRDCAVHKREAACKAERYRAKNGRASATEQFVRDIRENVSGAGCSACDRFWLMRGAVRRNLPGLSGQS